MVNNALDQDFGIPLSYAECASGVGAVAKQWQDVVVISENVVKMEWQII